MNRTLASSSQVYTVVIDNSSRGAVSVECALGQLREYLGHGVHPLIRLHVGNCQEFGAVCTEVSVEELVHEVHLTDDVDQVEELAEDELVGVGIVSSNRLLEVVHHHESAVNY